MTTANDIVSELLAIDIDEVRNKGRSTEVLRGLIAEAKECQCAAMRGLLGSVSGPDPYAKATSARGA